MLVSISPNYVAYTFERKYGEMLTVLPNSVSTVHLKCFLVERFNSETNKNSWYSSILPTAYMYVLY